MKRIIVVFFLLISSSAFGKSLVTLECRIFSSQSSIVSTVYLQSGMKTEVKCDKISCPKDTDQFAIEMNYNGHGYEDINLIVHDKKTDAGTYTKYQDIKVGSHIEFQSYQNKKNQFLTIDCEVTAVQ